MAQTSDKLKLLRRELCRDSILDFAKIYFPQYMTTSSCSFHEEICNELMGISERRDSRIAIAAPRGYAKSTVVTLFYVAWSICYEKEKFILILSATAKQARTLLSDIAKALVSNKKLLEDFSDVFAKKDSVKTKWTQDEIITNNDIKVMALGSEQDLRGLKQYQDRPTLVILDDVDSEKNTYNAACREKLFNWFIKTVLKAGAKDFNAVAVGTLLHQDSLLSRLIKPEEFPDWKKMIYRAVLSFSNNVELWKTWSNILFSRGDLYEEACGLKAADKFFEAHKQEMLDGTEVLWPQMEDYYKLMKIRETEGAFSFDSEKQNDPKNAQECRYDPEKFFYWDDEFSTVEQLLASFNGDYSIIAACDPSVGVISARADYSAIIVLAKHRGKLYVIDENIMQRPQEDLVQAIINFCKIRRPMDKFVIEENLFPELLVKYVRERATHENVLVPLSEVRNTKNKELRIFGMETFITTGVILFSRRQQILMDQLKYFPRGDHDDGPDALEMALREADKGTIFLPMDDIRDKHGRSINDRDFGQTTPEEDTMDEDDLPPPQMGGFSLT